MPETNLKISKSFLKVCEKISNLKLSGHSRCKERLRPSVRVQRVQPVPGGAVLQPDTGIQEARNREEREGTDRDSKANGTQQITQPPFNCHFRHSFPSPLLSARKKLS